MWEAAEEVLKATKNPEAPPNSSLRERDATDPESIPRDSIKLAPTTDVSYLGIHTWSKCIWIYWILWFLGNPHHQEDQNKVVKMETTVVIFLLNLSLSLPLFFSLPFPSLLFHFFLSLSLIFTVKQNPYFWLQHTLLFAPQFRQSYLSNTFNKGIPMRQSLSYTARLFSYKHFRIPSIRVH